MLVSHDGNIAHAELHIAAHPTDAQKLVGMATTVRDAGSKITLGVTEILNATNGQRGEGASFDYGAALQDVPYLAPHAVSEAVIWRVKPASMRHTDLSFTATVEGRAARP